MKIIVFGSKGMLGRYVTTYFNQYYKVVEINRNAIDASSATEQQLTQLLKTANITSDDVIINCIGTIKPMVDSLGDLNAIKVNSVFPRELANTAEKLNIKLIHPTTDCVFSGKRGSYNENDVHDVTDVYGRTKSLGEPANCTVVRTSIIGEEVNQGRSLVEWIKSQNNKTVFGFTNHFWNGVTCLQFAKICHKIIEANNFWLGTKHFHSDTVTKLQLVNLVADTYKLNLEIIPKEAGEVCDRTLSTKFDANSQFLIPDLSTQIQEMKEFSKLLYGGN